MHISFRSCLLHCWPTTVSSLVQSIIMPSKLLYGGNFGSTVHWPARFFLVALPIIPCIFCDNIKLAKFQTWFFWREFTLGEGNLDYYQVSSPGFLRFLSLQFYHDRLAAPSWLQIGTGLEFRIKYVLIHFGPSCIYRPHRSTAIGIRLTRSYPSKLPSTRRWNLLENRSVGHASVARWWY